MIVAGIDEAGKGPVLGPMIIAIFEVDEACLGEVLASGAKDSKLLSENKREEILSRLEKIGSGKVKVISPQELDSRDCSLNEFEMREIAKLIDSSRAEEFYIDSIEANGERLAEKIRAHLRVKRTVRIIAKPKADRDYPVVSAASIFAKVRRELEVAKLKKVFGDFGSGYPSDERTLEYLKNFIAENGAPPSIARKSWETVRKLIKGGKDPVQKKLF